LPRSLATDALTAACADVGLDSSGAEVIYQRASTVYKLESAPVVARLRYTSGSAGRAGAAERVGAGHAVAA
jgi:hypothetical protein